MDVVEGEEKEKKKKKTEKKNKLEVWWMKRRGVWEKETRSSWI